jgi:hypothetical protein
MRAGVMIRIARVPARVRRDVQSLPAWGDSGRKVLEDYARGIEAMRKRDNGPGDPKDPLSWRFQAAIHGFPGLSPRSRIPCCGAAAGTTAGSSFRGTGSTFERSSASSSTTSAMTRGRCPAGTTPSTTTTRRASCPSPSASRSGATRSTPASVTRRSTTLKTPCPFRSNTRRPMPR